MATYNGSEWIIYNRFHSNYWEYNAGADNYKLLLLADTYVPAVTHSQLTDVNSHEIPSTNTGYTTGGFNLVSKTWGSIGIGILGSNKMTMTVGTAGMSPKYAVLYNDSVVNKYLIAYCVLDVVAGVIPLTNLINFEIEPSASEGLFKITGDIPAG